MKQKVYKKESRVSTQIRESGLFLYGFLKLVFGALLTQSAMKISREDSKC